MLHQRQASSVALCTVSLQARLEADLASKDQQCSDLQRELEGRRDADSTMAVRVQQLQAALHSAQAATKAGKEKVAGSPTWQHQLGGQEEDNDQAMWQQVGLHWKAHFEV